VKDINIYIVRHGEASTDWGGHQDPGLSLEGKSQAYICASGLAKFNSKSLQILSSPRKRAFETAKPLGKLLNKPIRILESFNEIPSHRAKKKLQWLRGIAKLHSSKLPNYLQRWKEQIMLELSMIDKDTIIFSHFMVINAIFNELNNSKQFVSIQPGYASIMHITKKENRLSYVGISNENISKIVV